MVSSSDQFLEQQGDGGGIIRPLLDPVKMKDSALLVRAYCESVRSSIVQRKQEEPASRREPQRVSIF
jgi:hypothetical protein